MLCKLFASREIIGSYMVSYNFAEDSLLFEGPKYVAELSVIRPSAFGINPRRWDLDNAWNDACIEHTLGYIASYEDAYFGDRKRTVIRK